jgi:hypothetical protein
LIQEDLPINPLIRHQNPTENAQVAYEIANLIRCFAPQLGASLCNRGKLQSTGMSRQFWRDGGK